MKPKALILLYAEDPRWLSCLKIHAGLLEAYQKLADVEVCYLENSIRDYRKVTEALLKQSFDHLVLLDHRIPAAKILSYLNQCPPLVEHRDHLNILIHAFGPFKGHLPDWLLVHQLGRGWRIKIVLPCQGQLEHFQGILTEPAAAQLLPCLIDSQRWSLIQQVAAQRSDSKKLKIGYLGRLSRLKNILPMIDLFAPLIARGECELHLAGPFDDFDKNDITKGVGFYMKDVLERLEGQPGVYYHKVKQTDEEVYSFLAGLDGFCTLSTQGGEDFCFAVAEALAMGLPCLVNAWMALNDHAQRSSLVTLLENRTNAAGEFDPSSVAASILESFLNQCKKRHPPAPQILNSQIEQELLELLIRPALPFKGLEHV